jgi:hypothetical protein
MPARSSSLDVLDGAPSALPHGTEVTTRVERLLEDRRLPPGLIGRVTRARDGGFDVQVLGIGEVWFRREELLPRREGQVAFAVRRDAAWTALRSCAVLEATVGSRAWGLATRTSDTDVRGAFLLPFSWTVGLVEAPRDLLSADGARRSGRSRRPSRRRCARTPTRSSSSSCRRSARSTRWARGCSRRAQRDGWARRAGRGAETRPLRRSQHRTKENAEVKVSAARFGPPAFPGAVTSGRSAFAHVGGGALEPRSCPARAPRKAPLRVPLT